MNTTELPNRPHFRNWLLLGSLALMGFSHLGAQGFGPGPGAPGTPRLTPEEMMERMITRMDERLDLTDEQEAEIREIMKAGQEKRRAFLDEARDAESEGEARDLIKKAHEVQEDINHQIRDLLTREQRKEFKEMQKRMEKLRGRIGSRGANAGPPPMGGGEPPMDGSDY